MRAWLAGCGVAAMVMASAAAEAEPAARQEVTVPFAFLVNGQELPAGTYAVLQDDDGGSALLIQGKRASAYVMTAPVSRTATPQDTSLVFTTDGGRYRLAEIWNDEGDGLAIVDSAR